MMHIVIMGEMLQCLKVIEEMIEDRGKTKLAMY